MISALKTAYQRLAVRRVFSRWAETYEADVTGNHYSAAKAVLGALQPYLKEARQITDIGIGTGLIWQDIEIAQDLEITGLDLSPDMLVQASSNPDIGPLYLCDVGQDEWPVEDATQDLIVSAGLFEYLDEDMARHIFVEALRTLKDGGLFITTYIPGEQNTAKKWEGKSGTVLSYRFSPQWMEEQTELSVIHHTQPFKGSVFEDGSSYNYRLIILKKKD